MKKKKFEIPPPTCNKCGKEAPIDEKSSNENWKAYNVKEPCECGGIFKIKFEQQV